MMNGRVENSKEYLRLIFMKQHSSYKAKENFVISDYNI